jgi:tetratricopeptide (TPR) repeat protein
MWFDEDLWSMSSPVQDFKGTDRFLIQRRLGAGGFGVVYQAYDRECNTTVALKCLHKADAEALYRFKQEFRALSDVVHPNLVSLYELMSEGEDWFFTMELVEGINFLEYVQGNGNRQRVQTALRQLAEGINALHEAGKLHRDIKPSNVLVTKEDRVVLLDFGLATELATQSIYQSLNIVGTPAYMSPEQAANLPVTEATDWYSVGVMLYEALTGQLPFSGRPRDLLIEKQTLAPRAPNELVSDIPEALNSLCLDLLHSNPQKRPSGREVLRRLGTAQGETQRSPSVQDLPLVGRESHLAALEEAYRTMKEGRAVAVYVHGCSGIGKTVLVRRFLKELLEREWVVLLSGRCYEQESVPYKALDSVVDALSRYLRSLSPLEAEALMPIDLLALARLFPVLRQVPSVAGARRRIIEVVDSQELRQRAFVALRELLIRLSDRRPLILFIDDLQWGDLDSAALLGELLRPPDPPALMLIGSYQSEEADTNPFLQTLRSLPATAGPHLDLREVAVGEITPAEARELALALLGEKGSMTSAEIIALESGGNPFFIYELVRYFREGRGEGTEQFDSKATKKTLSGISLKGVIQARVLRLPEEARRLLEVVAVAGQPLERAVAKQAAMADTKEQASLALLRMDHLIRVTGTSGQERIETYHNRIREAVVANLTEETLKTHHHNLALVLETSGQVDSEGLAVHFQMAGDNEKATGYAAAAARQATEALAFEHAARLYKFTLDLIEQSGTPGATVTSAGNRLCEPKWLANFRLAYGEVLMHLSRNDGAQEQFKLGLKLSQDAGLALLQGKILRAMGDLFWRRGHYKEALVFCQEGLQLLREANDVGEECRLFCVIGNTYFSQGLFDQATEYYNKSLDLARRIGDRAIEGEALFHIGSIIGQQGLTEKAIDHLARALVIARDLRDREREQQVTMLMGNIHLMNAELSQALEHYYLSRALARAIGKRRGECRVTMNMGEICRLQGNLHAAQSFFNEAHVIAAEIQDRETEGYSLSNLGLLYQDFGETENALECFQQALSIFREIHFRSSGEVESLAGIAQILWRQDKVEEAKSYFEMAVASARELGLWQLVIPNLRRVAACERALGQPSAAREKLDEALAAVETIMSTNLSDFEYRLCLRFKSELREEENHKDTKDTKKR